MYVPVLFEVIPFDIDFSFHLKWITVYDVHNEGLFEWFTEVNNTLSSKAKQTTTQTTKQSNYTKNPNKPKAKQNEKQNTNKKQRNKPKYFNCFNFAVKTITGRVTDN